MLSHDSRGFIQWSQRHRKKQSTFWNYCLIFLDCQKKLFQTEEFTCREFDAMINLNNIVHHKVAVVASWVNGIMERVNRFLKSTLQKLVDEPLEAFSQ